MLSPDQYCLLLPRNISSVKRSDKLTLIMQLIINTVKQSMIDLTVAPLRHLALPNVRQDNQTSLTPSIRLATILNESTALCAYVQSEFPPFITCIKLSINIHVSLCMIIVGPKIMFIHGLVKLLPPVAFPLQLQLACNVLRTSIILRPVLLLLLACKLSELVSTPTISHN